MGMFQAIWFKDLLVDRPVQASCRNAPPTAPTAGLARKPVLIAFATQTGAAASIAEATLEQLEMAGIEARIVDFHDLDLEQLQVTEQVLFVTSTTFDGDPPDMAETFRDEAMGKPAPLGHLHYALLALGDSAYDEFCGFGHRLDDWLHASGAQAWFDLIEVDDEDEQAIACWHEQVEALAVTAGTHVTEASTD